MILCQMFPYPCFVRFVVSDIKTFDISCQIWYIFAQSIFDMISEGTPKEKDASAGSLIFVFISYWFMSIKYWSRSHLIYFLYRFYNSFMDEISSKLFKKQHLFEKKDYNFCAGTLVSFNYAFSIRIRKVFDLKNDEWEIKRWVQSTNRLKLVDSDQLMKHLWGFYHQIDRENKTDWEMTLYYRGELRNMYKANLRCCRCSKIQIDHGLSFKLCKKCKMVVYCSRRCQKSDWKRGHRHKCKEFRKVRRKYSRGKAGQNTIDAALSAIV